MYVKVCVTVNAFLLTIFFFILKAKVGDYIDLVQEKTDSQNRVQRVRILDILDDKTKSGKNRIVFRLWKKAFLVDAP